MGQCACLGKKRQQSQNPVQQSRLNHIRSQVLQTLQEREQFQNKVMPQLKKSFQNKSIKFQRIYLASQEGFTAASFHNATNNSKETLIIFRTKDDFVFGAFSPCTWQSDKKYLYEQDKSLRSFIFRLTKKRAENKFQGKFSIFKIRQTQKSYAIMNDSDYGPIFGRGHDIHIVDQCNTKLNWSNLGKTYHCSFVFGSDKANGMIAGKGKFLIEEYEVWKLSSL